MEMQKLHAGTALLALRHGSIPSVLFYIDEFLMYTDVYMIMIMQCINQNIILQK